MFGSSEYLPTFAVSKTKRIFSSVGLEHYLDRVGVGGSSPPRFTILPHGVMVAQQILVLFVKVRVLMRQLRRGARAPLFVYIPVAWDLTFFLTLRENVGLGYDFD